MRASLRSLLLALLLGCVVAACGGDPSAVAWRDLTMTLPDGWEQYDQSETLLYVADGETGDVGDPGDLTVAAQFTYEPQTTADDWRDFVVDEDATLEQDEAVEIGGVPATRLVYSFVTNGVPTREMVVVVPSRGVVGLLQPVPVQGQQDGPDVFLANVDDFDAIIDSIRFGAPADYLERDAG